mgnify:FL=1|tara:strand:- start:2754 stop:4361 length:1608 start_codon:yes stop_codon:yes gene_type:complete
MSEIAAEYIDIDTLTPHPDNPRINDHAIEELAGSIKRFGFASPIIARKEDSVIIAGHTRYKAAQSLGLSKVPVRFMDLDPVDAKLLMLADNKIGERADWDEDALQELFEELKDEDLSGLGWDEDELDGILDDLYSDEEEESIVEPPAPVQSDFNFTLLKGNCLEKLKEIPDNSIDSIVTDPPYEIGFMGKGWDDSGIAFNVELWKECYRVLKHGGHMVAFSATRTVHPMGVAIANAGFEIRDMISWLYFSGFPKSHDVSKGIDKHFGAERKVVGTKMSGIANPNDKNRHTIGGSSAVEVDITKPATPQAAQWQGWGTALKPSYEPAILARKPLEKGLSVAENVLKHNTGAINIDACRFAYGDPCWVGPQEETSTHSTGQAGRAIFYYGDIKSNQSEGQKIGRWPANVYQCPKASRSEREAGLEHLQGKSVFEAVDRNEGSAGLDNPRAGAGRTADHVKNFHPTVKPIGVMRWLCRLITPPNGTVLDPFLGSGTTAVAACLEGFDAIGCEMTEDYYPIIEGRIEWAKREREHGPQE